MRDMHRLLRNGFVGLFVLLVAAFGASAQTPLRMTIQANARGTSTQVGRHYDVNIHIDQLSPPEDRQKLIDAFTSSGMDGLRRALEDMKPKGRVRFSSGGVGNDVKYIIELPSEKGRRFRLVTDRNLAFAELYAGTRSREYSVSALELTITPDGKGTGRVLPACKLKLNKDKQVEIETFQFPWNLNIFRVSTDTDKD